MEDEERPCDHQVIACEHPEVLFRSDYVPFGDDGGSTKWFFVGLDDCEMQGFVDSEPDGTADDQWYAKCTEDELALGRSLLDTREKIAHYDEQSEDVAGPATADTLCTIYADLPPNDESHVWRFIQGEDRTPEVEALITYLFGLRDTYQPNP